MTGLGGGLDSKTYLEVLGQNLRLGTGVGMTRTENWDFRLLTLMGEARTELGLYGGDSLIVDNKY